MSHWLRYVAQVAGMRMVSIALLRDRQAESYLASKNSCKMNTVEHVSKIQDRIGASVFFFSWWLGTNKSMIYLLEKMRSMA